MRALLLKDAALCQDSLESVLRARGYDLSMTSEPADAWEWLRPEILPVLIVRREDPDEALDLCRQARGLPGGGPGLLLAVTTDSRPEYLQRLVEAGADEWLAEPFDPVLLDLRLAAAERRLAERKKSEAALRVTQFLLDRAPETAGWSDSEGNLLYMNDVGCKTLEYTRDELLAKKVQDVIPKQYAEVFEAFIKSLRNEGTATFESAHIAKSGRMFPVEVALNCLKFDGKEYFCAFVRDITDRKHAEEALRESEERYRGLFDGVPIGLYRTTPAGRMLDGNESLVRILGYPDQKTLLEANVSDIYLDPDDRLRWQRIVEAESGSGVSSFEARVRRYDGTVIWVRFSMRVYRDDQGKILRYEGALEDVTDRRVAEEALRASEERFRALVQNASDMISILELDGTLRYASPSHQRLLGHSAGDLIGGNLLDLVHYEDRPLLANALQCLVDLPDENLTIEYRCRHRDGTWLTLESTASNLLDHPAVTGLVLNSHDITDRKRAEERLLHDALHDELTGLPNRALFMDRLWQAMERARRDLERLTAVLFLDVDQFKIVNDSLGHLVGDELLIQIARALSSVLRPMDTIARIGGDEFAILIEGGKDVDDAVAVAGRIHERLAAPINLGGHEVFITASIGIAVHTPDYDKPEDLLRDADTAMYRAKSSGRACHVVFNRGMHQFVMARLQLESDLRRAIERGQIEVHYQPFVDLATGTVIGLEALMRWSHPRRGLILPEDFLNVAEETGLIVPIGEHVILQACRRVRELQLKYPEHRDLRVSVNLSNKQFFQSDLDDQIAAALAASGLAPEHLGLEITEGVIIRHAESATGRFTRLKALGVQLYLDDFGKGYSSLNYLHRYPMDILKIDRSFVSRIDEEGGNLSIVAAIVTLGHQLGMEVVAEGIQSVEHVAKLRGLKCEYGQGFFFSHPVDGDEVEALITRDVRDWPSPVPFAGRSSSVS
jgi:diguanylate cyclase (GGDEF)-like protein/PAS domain S-box-containing protein